MVAVTIGAWLALAAVLVAAWPRLNAEPGWRAATMALTLAFSLAHQLLYSTIAEDAFVTFRYARNIADGYGPVFNPGERVEGYSNFLWLVLITLPRAMFGGSVVTGAVVLGVLCTLGAVLLSYFLVNRMVADAQHGGAGMRGLGVAAAALTAGVSSLAAYGPSGLETSLFVLLVLTVCYAVAAQRPVVAGVIAALAAMTTPDGLVVAVVVGLWLVARAARGHTTAWAPSAYALGALVLLVPWTAWRLTFYDHPAGGGISPTERLGAGWDYLAGFALGYQAFLLLTAAAVALLLTRRRAQDPAAARARAVVWLPLLLAVAQSMFVGYAGGDPMPAWRLLAVVPPLLAVAAAAAYGIGIGAPSVPSPKPRAAALARRRTVPVVAAAVCGLSLVVTTAHPRMLPAMHEWRTATGQLEQIGGWLGENLPQGSVVSAYKPGALGYRAGPALVIVAASGRADEHLGARAQQPSAGAAGYPAGGDGYGGYGGYEGYDGYVVSRMPLVAVDTDTGYTAEQHCGMDPAFAGLYEVASFQRADTEQWVSLYVRRDAKRRVLELLEADGTYRHVPCA
nr:hypothetical protein [Saccharomonospora marina]